ncbi:hypothetical protein SUGI_1013560 [Cryptomeria japonica]|nr:hypothetical protein SUGI_1013560 [Cryptomeria japonica]
MVFAQKETKEMLRLGRRTGECWKLGCKNDGVFLGLNRDGLAVDKPTMCLGKEIVNEVIENENYFVELDLIGRCKGFWPGLDELHKWITEFWSPILEGDVQIYLSARGFFMVVFDNE